MFHYEKLNKVTPHLPKQSFTKHFYIKAHSLYWDLNLLRQLKSVLMTLIDFLVK
jgi:hypothetical protein